MQNATTALLNSTTTLNSGLRLTELERRYGRLMRSPDGHADAGSADAGAASAAGDAGAGGDAGASGADAGASDAGAAGDDSTVLGSAATDTGAGDDKGAGSGADAAAKAAADKADDGTGVPEAYELKLTSTNEAGEETSTDLDAGLVEIATPMLKDAGLSNEQANKLLPLVPQIQERMLTQMNDEFAATRADWAKQAQADPEIGGKNWEDTQRLAAKALDHFTGPAVIKGADGKEAPNEFRKLLNDSGLGNHPAMIKAFRSIGAALSEDTSFTRNTVTTEQPKSREQVNYPNDLPKTS